MPRHLQSVAVGGKRLLLANGTLKAIAFIDFDPADRSQRL